MLMRTSSSSRRRCLAGKQKLYLYVGRDRNFRFRFSTPLTIDAEEGSSKKMGIEGLRANVMMTHLLDSTHRKKDICP
jgi:hypothetical protein